VSGSAVNQGSAKALPTTGRALPQYDREATLRETAAKAAMRRISIAYPKQLAIMERIEALRLSTLGVRGLPLPGLRLSQVSQAGKTKTFERYITELKARTAAEGLPSNPHQVVYLGLKRRVTVKMLYQRLLMQLGDAHPDKGNLEILVQRAEEFLLKFGVELLIVDEVQHLANTRTDSNEVTDELKSFLDQGLVPVVFAGNEDSRPFFEENMQLSARLGTPLELTPVDLSTKAEASMFKTFCIQLDQAIANEGVTKMLSGFEAPSTLQGLLVTSGGHVGRVCRIVGAALEHAARREADYIERYDLAYAVENLAIPSRWTLRNPFSGEGK
jgi:hypothetical protein